MTVIYDRDYGDEDDFNFWVDKQYESEDDFYFDPEEWEFFDEEDDEGDEEDSLVSA